LIFVILFAFRLFCPKIKQQVGDMWKVQYGSIIIIIITDLYSSFRSGDTEAFDAAQEV